jgi:hypothetical protein
MADVHRHISLDERADKATTSTASPENKIKEINYLEKYPNLGTSRWFLRGWTLQELIVPRNVVFYDNDWRVIAKVQDIARVVERFTEIPVPVLLSGVTESYCVAEKKGMGIEAKNQTTRRYGLLPTWTFRYQNEPLIRGGGTSI